MCTKAWLTYPLEPHRRSKMLLKINECGSKITRNSAFYCHLSPVRRKLTIKNSVFNYFLSTFADSIEVFDCQISAVRPGRIGQSVACLATDASLTADPGIARLIPTWSHTLVAIDHEIISAVILLPSAESFKRGCCQLQAKVCASSTG